MSAGGSGGTTPLAKRPDDPDSISWNPILALRGDIARNRSDGDDYTLEVPWKYVICGPAVKGVDDCRGPNGKRRKAQ